MSAQLDNNVECLDHHPMASLSTLPFEVAENIFSLCLPSDTFITPDSHQAPLLLAQICREWRQAALTSTGLWASLCLDHDKDSEHAALILKTWLDRSLTRPVSLSISQNLLQFDFIKTLFLGCSSRWRHIEAYIDYNSSNWLWDLKFFSESPKFLEIFHLTTFGDPSPHAHKSTHLSIVLNSAPRLKHFAWKNSWDAPLLDLEWSRLTSVQLSGSTDWMPIFLHGHNLVRLVHGLVHSKYLRLSALVPNSLQYLRTLAMRADRKSLEALFGTLTLPSLTYLEIFFYADVFDSPRVAQALIGLLERSQCPLEDLDLHDYPLTESDVIQILRCVRTTLRELTLEQSGVAIVRDTLLGLLSKTDEPDSEPCLCPRLVSLALYECMQCSAGALARMIRSRQPHDLHNNPVSPIQLIELYDTDVELEHLKILQSEGLIVKVYSHTTLLPQLDPEDEERLQRMYENGFPKQQMHILSSSGWG